MKIRRLRDKEREGKAFFFRRAQSNMAEESFKKNGIADDVLSGKAPPNVAKARFASFMR